MQQHFIRQPRTRLYLVSANPHSCSRQYSHYREYGTVHLSTIQSHPCWWASVEARFAGCYLRGYESLTFLFWCCLWRSSKMWEKSIWEQNMKNLNISSFRNCMSNTIIPSALVLLFPVKIYNPVSSSGVREVIRRRWQIFISWSSQNLNNKWISRLDQPPRHPMYVVVSAQQAYGGRRQYTATTIMCVSPLGSCRQWRLHIQLLYPETWTDFATVTPSKCGQSS